MAHLFNKAEYFDYKSKIYSTIKKNLQGKIEFLSQNLTQNLHPIEATEEVLIDGSQFNLLYDGETTYLPVKLLEVDSFSTIFNMTTLQENFNHQELQQLANLTPSKNIQNIQHVLEGQGLYQNSLQNFERKIKSGYFTSFREKEDEINSKLNNYRLKDIYQNLYQHFLQKKTKQNKREKLIFEDDGSSVESINEIQEINQMSENSNATETEEEVEQVMDEQFSHQVYFKYDYSKIKNQEELLALGEEKGVDKKLAMYRITLPTRPRNGEWVENYRKQELGRYSNPTKPWIYSCEDGRKVTVAPVAKKISVLTGKPRDHPLLKSERPACVTILTLVRDAAARLPSGVGTRADISELLKQSQYVNEDLPEEKLSNIVSGALDRLHYMADACVKYDAEKKLWIYLHIDRNNEHPGWGEDGEEYTEKNNKKKKPFSQEIN